MLHSGLLFFLAVGPIFSTCQDGPIVNISLGAILGVIQTSRNGNDFYSFRGIRYAKPPIGELRFKPPVPVEPWDGIFNATADGPICYQTRFTGLSEDCLGLNVYTRRINQTISRPVLFYIHGGSYAHWSGNSKLRGPDYLMDHDIVLVTINYRLGTLGFFSTGDKHSPGNYGMKDQVLALKWVKANIHSFGGDTSRITISGESAGAASVGLHLVSPMSRGLFHGAMLISGSPISLWATNKDPIVIAKKQALLLNCSTESTELMVDCMRKVPVKDIIHSYGNLLEWNGVGVFHSPVIETDNEDQEKFLTQDPLTSLINEDVADVPIVIGTTRDEMIGRAFRIIYNKDCVEDLSLNWNRIAPIIGIYERNDTASEQLREFYFENLSRPLTNDSMNSLGQFISDGIIIFGVIRTTKLLAARHSKPVYLYQFNYKSDYSVLNWPDTNDAIGVAHGVDMFYVFYESYFNPKFNTTSKDGELVNKLTLLWKNFIEEGNPTPEPSEVLNNVTWTPYTDENPKYLDIDMNLRLVDGLYYQKRMALWESLFPLTKS